MPDETVNEKLRDRIIRHAVYVERYKSGVVKRLLAALAEGEDALRRQLTERLDRLAERGFDTGPASTARLEQMIRAIEQLRAEQLGALAESLPPADVDVAAPRAAASTVGGTLSEELADFAQQEAAWNAAVLAQSIPQPIVVRLDLITPSSAQVYAAAMSRPFQGRLLREFYQGLVAADQQRLRRTLREGYLTGRSTQQIVRDLVGSRSQGGRNGALFQSRRNAETVVRTAVQHTASMARREVGRQNSRVIKGWKHVSSLDSRTSPECVLADGKVYQADDPAIRWPPLHPQCVLPDCKITPSGPVSYITKRPFNGEVIVIRTLGNHELATTGNHPIMTDRGFVPAELVKQGDRVVSRLGTDSLRASRDDNQMESAIEDRFDALVGSGCMTTAPMPTAAEDFHGDVTENEVGVILFNHKLTDAMVPAIAHQFVESFLKVTGMRALIYKSTFSDFSQYVSRLFETSGCIVSFGGESGDFFRSRVIHAGLLLLGSVPGADPVSQKKAINDLGGSAERLSDATGTLPCAEHGNDAISIKQGMFQDITGTDSMLMGDPIAGGSADAGYARDFFRLIPLAEKLDTVIDVSVRRFSGHVYNLMCGDGVYSASGIITHNCRSTLIPLTKSWKELGIDRDEVPPGTRASMDGQVPADTTYGDWLRRQSAGVQDEVLGKTRADAFRRGNLPIERFIDDKGRWYTLDELRKADKLPPD